MQVTGATLMHTVAEYDIRSTGNHAVRLGKPLLVSRDMMKIFEVTSRDIFCAADDKGLRLRPSARERDRNERTHHESSPESHSKTSLAVESLQDLAAQPKRNHSIASSMTGSSVPTTPRADSATSVDVDGMTVMINHARSYNF